MSNKITATFGAVAFGAVAFALPMLLPFPVTAQILYCSDALKLGIVFVDSLSTANRSKVYELGTEGKIRIASCFLDNASRSVDFVLGDDLAGLLNEK